MYNVKRWLEGAGAAAFGVICLFLAANVESGDFYGFGISLFISSVLYIFNLIKISFDEAEQKS